MKNAYGKNLKIVDEADTKIIVKQKKAVSKLDCRSKVISKCSDFKFGSLTYGERRDKIVKFIRKKRLHKRGKYIYECRKRVAERRLRIRGRFVTKE